jgi:serine/threonine-protein kinase
VIERELGRGGMATVYLAHDLRHARPVALKVLRSDLATTLGPERFLLEIRTTARLQHSHILPVFDSGEDSGHLWYVMPYVEGESLRLRLTREKQLPVDDAIQITRNVLSALAYAHACGVVHRDIKPENILLERGDAVLGDFGIAHAVTAAGSERLTETGLTLGTPAYMSPEQSAGERALDGRSDLYSLGCVLYEMLAGAPPFTGPSAQAVLARHALDPVPPLRTVRSAVPGHVEAAVRKALEKVAADRFGTAAEFAEALIAGALMTPPLASTTGGDAAGTPSFSVQPPQTRGVRRVLGALGLAVLAGASIVLSRRSPSPATTTAPAAPAVTRLAVLPFENLGDSADAYFADGITDAVRGKLTALSGLRVTARTSSSQYRTTRKSPQQIGKELGVQYLLTGTVRWQKAPDGGSRVQVSPELIEASSAAAKWQAPFDAAMTDMFKVQGDIAERVAGALDVALGAKEYQILAEKPTQIFGAYDAFLKGEELSGRGSGAGPTTLHRAVGHYRQAVALDSTFVMAWVRLASLHSIIFYGGYGGRTAGLAEADAARRAAERALALRPDGYEGHLAMGSYYLIAVGEYQRALNEATQGLRIAPGRPELLNLAASAEMSLGLWDSALVHSQRGQLLDPRSFDAAKSVALVLVYMRRYPEALATCERGLMLAPGDPYLLRLKAITSVALGDLSGAQTAIRVSPRREGVPEVALNEIMAFWWLEAEDQRRLVHLSPVSFDHDTSTWGAVLAETYWLLGDKVRARVYADSARRIYEALIQNSHDYYTDAVRHSSLGLMLAYLGRRSDAVRDGTRGMVLMPVAKDAINGAWIQYQLARIYLLVGESEKALDQLEPLLRTPSFLSPGWLRLDPGLASLRGNPRFERLTKGRI